MKDVCIVNQSITDEFKLLDDEHYQEEYKEHQRKMNIINSYEEEIKKVLFLSSGCVSKTTNSYDKYGVGIKPDYISVAKLLDKVQSLKAKKLGLVFNEYNCGYYGNFADESVEYEQGLVFILKYGNNDYLNYFISIVNKYSLEFFNKEYFSRCEGSGLWSTYYILVTKDETWKMEYLRNDDTLKTPLGFLYATLIPVFGWAFLLYSTYVAIALYFKHVSKQGENRWY